MLIKTNHVEKNKDRIQKKLNNTNVDIEELEMFLDSPYYNMYFVPILEKIIGEYTKSIINDRGFNQDALIANLANRMVIQELIKIKDSPVKTLTMLGYGKSVVQKANQE